MHLNQQNAREIQELQALEQSLQSFIMQKQAFQSELEETEKAISSLAKSGEEIYTMIGQLFLKIGKAEAQAELSKKKELLELRLRSIEQQEKKLIERMDALREKISRKIQ
jgi:prefoldin beta subunit